MWPSPDASWSTPMTGGSGSKPNSDGSPGSRKPFRPANPFIHDPEEAETFVARTGCDSLAIAIGTSHGPCKFSGEARLDFERLDAIAARLPGVPLVLHGASSVPQEAVAAVNAHGGNVAGASGVPEDLLPPRRRLPPFARSILIRICGWPSPPPSGPCLRSVPKPSILAPI